MEIKSTFTNTSGQVLDVLYRDIESELDFAGKEISAVHAFCFYGDKLVVARDSSRNCWTIPGGSVEEGEDVRSAVNREVQEESNMKVIQQRFVGYQEIVEPKGVLSQTRSVCTVEPYGDFVSDPDGDISEIKFIDPADFKKYVDWGVIGDRLMERALQVKIQMQLELNSTR